MEITPQDVQNSAQAEAQVAALDTCPVCLDTEDSSIQECTACDGCYFHHECLEQYVNSLRDTSILFKKFSLSGYYRADS